MTLTSTDTQALDLLSAPRAMTVVLRRCVSGRNPAVVLPPVKKKMTEAAQWKDDLLDVAVATWWPSLEGAPAEDAARRRRRRTLDGEIQLPRTLTPSCFIAYFSVQVCRGSSLHVIPDTPWERPLQYTVVVLPFKAIAFASADTEPLLKTRVEIATTYARGAPRPRTFSPPDYADLPVL